MASPKPQTRRTVPSDAPARWYGRVPWTAVAISLAVVLSSAFAIQPIRDPSTGADVAEAYLVKPLSYVAIAPVSSVLDMMTLLSLKQHIALFAGLLVFVALWRVWRAWRRGGTWRGHVLAFTAAVVGWLAVAAATALLPRPMASLGTDNANVVRVDFHSHTDASHDTRQSVEDNRGWHARGGFDVAYVTDHYAVSGAERAVATNPRIAGEGTVLLQAIETAWNGEHVTILGAERSYKGLMTPNFRDVDTLALRLASTLAGREPVVVWNHPREMGRLPAASGSGTPGVRAMEIVNGGPRDIDRVVGLRTAILEFARQHNLALTASTDNHGWGRAVPGWTLLRIFNWRALAPDDLAAQIETVLRGGGVQATRVVERTSADPRRMVWASAFTAPWRMLTTLSGDERVVWLLWTWLVTGAVWLWRRRRATA